MRPKYCIACGENKRLTWPKSDPECCTMTCAAVSFVFQIRDVSEVVYCGLCGSLCTDCESHDCIDSIDR